MTIMASHSWRLPGRMEVFAVFSVGSSGKRCTASSLTATDDRQASAAQTVAERQINDGGLGAGVPSHRVRWVRLGELRGWWC
jgi:hypothetical protein